MNIETQSGEQLATPSDGLRAVANSRLDKSCPTGRKCLNLGCGLVHLPGWVNADANPLCEPDVVLPKSGPLPFADSMFDAVLLDHVLEHIQHTEVFGFLDEVWRVLKPGGTLDIYVPHSSGPWAHSNLSHCIAFSAGALDCLGPDGGRNTVERYGKAIFALREERLHLLGHNMPTHPWLPKLSRFADWAFNFSFGWRKICERLNVFGFDEIFFKLEAIKNPARERPLQHL